MEAARGEPPPTRRRRLKRRLVVKPPPDVPGQVVSELISVVKCSLASVVQHPDFLALLEQVVVAVNQMTKRVSMLAKELLLAKLEAGEQLPTLNQSFYSALYTSLRNGKWSHGYNALLAKRRVADPGLGSVMTQAMALAAKKLAAEVDAHYRKHYDRFHNRWSRVFFLDAEKQGAGANPYKLDSERTQLEVLVQAAWAMRRDFEARAVRGFALFPETSAKVSYVTLDATCVAYLYRTLYPQSFRVAGKRPGTTKAQPINDVAMEHSETIFEQLFNLAKIRRLRRRNHHFRYALQTDGIGVALSFGRWVNSWPQSSSDGSPPPAKRRKKEANGSQATTKAVGDLCPGFAYSATNKKLASFDKLRDTNTTVRAVDPGVRRTYTSVDLLTEEEDVRNSVLKMRSCTWTSRTRAKEHGNRMKRWRDAELDGVQQQLNAVPFRTSASAVSYGYYVDATLAHWDALWAFSAKRKVRKLRFRRDVDAQSTLDREVDRLCAPRAGDARTLLLYGNAATTNLFGKTKKNVKGPARKLFDTAVRRKKAVCVWADEFRTSRLDVYGHRVVHPPETREEHLQPAPCKAERHAQDAPGCRCFCSHRSGCGNKRTKARWCPDHVQTQLRYNVCYSKQRPKGKHRMWNRDVLAALNIGCLFLATCLGLDTALWKRGTTDIAAPRGTLTPPLSWADIFGRAGHALPFSLPTALLPSLDRVSVQGGGLYSCST